MSVDCDSVIGSVRRRFKPKRFMSDKIQATLFPSYGAFLVRGDRELIHIEGRTVFSFDEM